MAKANNSMVKHTSIYGISTVIRNITGLVMLPIYTRFLAPADYAVLELLSMSIDFAGIVIANRIGDGVFRFYMLANSDSEKKSVMSSSFLLAICLNTVGFLLLYAASSIIAKIVFGDASLSSLLKIFAITLVTEAVIHIPLLYIRAIEKPYIFLAANVFKLLLQVTLNIYFVVHLQLAVEGVVYGALISSVSLGLAVSIYMISHTGIKISPKIMKDIFIFSLPIGLGTIASFFITYGDRYFIRVFHDLTEVGLYTLAYKFAFIFAALSYSPFAQMWDVQKYNVAKEPNAQSSFKKIFNLLNAFLITFAFTISIFIKDFLVILSNQAYWSAANLVPLLLVAYIFNSWFYFTNFGLLYTKNTRYIAISEWIAGAVIGLLYFALIPQMGALGAALATLIVFYGRFLILHRYSKKYYDMGLDFTPAFYLLLLAMGVYGIAYLSAPDELILSILYRSALFLFYIVLVLKLPILSVEEKTEIYQFFSIIFFTVIKKLKLQSWTR